MYELNIKRTIFTPDIFLNKGESFFLLSGKSVTENAEEFYSPILNWFTDYFKNPSNLTDIILYFEYMNSASSLQIGNLIDILIKNKNKTNLIINWLYERDDELSKDAGQEYQHIYEFNFNFIEVTEELSDIFIF